MGDLFFQIALAVGGGVASSLIASWLTDLKSVTAIGLGVAVSLAWIGIAIVLRQKGRGPDAIGTVIGSKLKAKGGVTIKGVDVRNSPATVAKDVASGESIRVENIKVER